MTDAILSTLMCASRSQYSWDIVVDKIGNKIFFDKRENTEFDLLTVSETSGEPPQVPIFQMRISSLLCPKCLHLQPLFYHHISSLVRICKSFMLFLLLTIHYSLTIAIKFTDCAFVLKLLQDPFFVVFLKIDTAQKHPLRLANITVPFCLHYI